MSPQSKELDAKNRTIASIFRISSLLTQRVSLDEILRSILVSAEKELGFSASCLFLMNDDQEQKEDSNRASFLLETMNRQRVWDERGSPFEHCHSCAGRNP